MAGTTRRSLAGTAAAAAKRVIGRKASDAEEPAPAKAAATKAPAKKAPATKAPAKKAAATKAPAKKAPATKAAAKKAPAKKTSTTKSATPSTPTEKAVPVTKAAPAPTQKAAPAKKARKATPSTLVVLEGEDPWTRAELNEVVKELREHQERLTTIVDRSEEELAGLMRDAGDGAGQDQADLGATSFERDHEFTVLAKERETLAQIERALAHIDDGSYGVCDSCGNAIGKNRLMAVPHATLCMSCKQREERR